MASKQTYPCFACRKAGYEIPVYLDGKDEQGRTKYLNEDGTKHYHKKKYESEIVTQFRSAQEENPLAPVSDEAVDRGITAFSMMSSLIVLVEQTQKLLVTMDEKLTRLINLAERKQV